MTVTSNIIHIFLDFPVTVFWPENNLKTFCQCDVTTLRVPLRLSWFLMAALRLFPKGSDLEKWQHKHQMTS